MASHTGEIVTSDSHHRGRGDGSSPRPTWWVLLAVSMAIMALVFAHSAGAHNHKTPPVATDPLNFPTFVTRSGPSVSRSLKQVSPIPIQSSTTTTTDIASRPTNQDAPVETSPTYVPTETDGSVESYPGYLSYPDNITTSYPIDNVGANVTASVSVAANANVEVSISCSGTQQTAAGTSNVSISMTAASPPCTVQLTDETNATDPVPYNLTVTTAKGS